MIWYIFNDRDMYCGEFKDKEEAHARCRELNAQRTTYTTYRVVATVEDVADERK